MKTKICTKCKIEKELNEFNKRRSRPNGVGVVSRCKKCEQEYYLENKEKIDIRNKNNDLKRAENRRWECILLSIRKRCNPNNKDSVTYGQRGIKCLLSKEEIKFLWFRDRAYEMKRPSIDRINNDGNYCVENCQFLEMPQNSRKNALSMPRDSKGIFIKKY